MTIFQNACHSDWTDRLVAIQIVQSSSVGRPHGCENNPPESWHNQMTRHPPPHHANGLSENDSHDGPQSHNHLSLQSPLITWVIYFISHPNLGASNTIASKSTSPLPPMTFLWKIDWGRSTYQGSLKNLQGFGHSISRIASYRFRLYYVPEKGSSSSPNNFEEQIIIVCRMLKIWKSWISFSHPINSDILFLGLFRWVGRIFIAPNRKRVEQEFRWHSLSSLGKENMFQQFECECY